MKPVLHDDKKFKLLHLKNELSEFDLHEEDESRLKIEMRDGIVILHPQESLREEDFIKLKKVVDPWIEKHGLLMGLVICIPKFPGWENFAGFVQHIEFIKSHERKIRRVALAVDGLLPELMSQIAGLFIQAKIRQFPFENAEDAIQWAAGAEEED